MVSCNAKAKTEARLDGKTAIVTGCNTGIGKMTALDFYKRGAHVIMACRSLDKANAALENIKELCVNEKNLGKIEVIHLDLSSLNSVRKCANALLEKLERIDVLINNGAIMMCPYSKTEDDHEIQFGTNHLGHFLLTIMLLPKMIRSTPARIVNVSSMGHKRGTIKLDDLNWEKRSYVSFGAYAQSKIANILFAKELARRLEETGIEGVTTYSLHPGIIATEIDRHFDETYFQGLTTMYRTLSSKLIKSPMQGAQTTIHCAVDEEAGKETGLYYAECKVTKPSTKAQNMDDAKRLWEISMEMVGLDKNYNPFKA